MTHSISIDAPVPLFEDNMLNDTDRRLWMVIQHDQTYLRNNKINEKTYLAARSHHSRTTIYSSLKRLADAGWYDPIKQQAVIKYIPGQYHSVFVPATLIFAENLSDAAVIGYCRLKATPDQVRRACHNKDLAKILGVCVNTAKKIIAALADATWLIVQRKLKNKKPSVAVSIDTPDERYERLMTNLLANRLELHKERRGEVIAQTIIEFLADTEICVNGFYSYLRNPATGELMQIDICLPAFKVAFEYNGKFHDEPKQMERDITKERLLNENSYTFFVLTVFDLSLERIAALLAAAGIPLRDISRYPRFTRRLIKRAQEVAREILESIQQQGSPAAGT